MTYPPPPSGQDPYSAQPDPYAPPPSANPYATPPSYGSPAVPGAPASVPPAAPQSGQPYADPYKSAAPYAAPQQPYGQQPYGGYPPPRQQNSMALVALILSLVGLMTWITAPIGAILGHSAMKQIRQSGEDGEGMAKAAIIVGWIITGLGVVGCLCAFGLPFLAVLGAGGASSY
ncbi:DUF4190 domain-containing protein [Catellatospora sichuanensis]|uniref:DUF4190 domain-containing protein n=1 Tax=Catellatospora sichuanensis TaxID=1969805 RepID=UPI001182EAFD|nr:DUF4190 domain-containing protein [Catellatospora sichuanensis]